MKKKTTVQEVPKTKKTLYKFSYVDWFSNEHHAWVMAGDIQDAAKNALYLGLGVKRIKTIQEEQTGIWA